MRSRTKYGSAGDLPQASGVALYLNNIFCTLSVIELDDIDIDVSLFLTV